ncbi:short neuropeptide F-like [Musca autumnalis]|uniref:short neuropeptide F-like n=1 Tax=Musca autumnalis TaxID=221902 RepID=UPI003CE90B05
MHFQSQLLCNLLFGTFLIILMHSSVQSAAADMPMGGRDSLNSFYENLLQREYQLQRKAQRSPSLRLRFGRRSDPDMLTQLPEKRWFGDVNQKTIRSPSLRLRFGRRSDPTMPLRSPFDLQMNSLQNDDARSTDSTNTDNDDDYNEIFDNIYERVVRKPQRLRFGRSLPKQHDLSAVDNTENKNGKDSVITIAGDNDKTF